MGQEILYCSICSERVLGADLEKGRALRSGHQIACFRCAPEFRNSHPEVSTQTPSARTGPDARSHAPQRRGGSTVRIPVTHARLPGPSLGLLVGGGLGAVAVLLLVVYSVSGPSGNPPVPKPPEMGSPVKRKDPHPAARPPEDPGRAQAAEKAVLAARAATASGDVEAAYEAWDAALRASDRTPWYAEAATAYQAALEQRRAAWKASMEEGEKELRASFERGDPTAWRAIVARLRLRHRGAEWTAKVDDLGARAERAAADLADAARVARPWTPIFDGKSLECLRGSCRDFFAVEEGAIILRKKGSAAQTSREFGDGEFRIRFQMQDLESCFFAVQQSERGTWTVPISGERVRRAEGGPHELVVVVRAGKAEAALDGHPLDAAKHGSPDKGAIQFNGSAKVFRVLAIEFRE